MVKGERERKEMTTWKVSLNGTLESDLRATELEHFIDTKLKALGFKGKIIMDRIDE